MAEAVAAVGQTTQHVDNGERILGELTRLRLANDQPPLAQRGHNIASVSAHGRSNLVAGDVYNYGVLFGPNQEPDEIKAFGLCLGSAPLIDADNFVGRAAELDQMKRILRPDGTATEQQRLVLGGMGGVGKTQLAIAYARLYQARYTSVFWLDATTELNLKQSFRSIARRLLKSTELEKLDDEQIIHRAHDWLSDTRNTEWLLIFDNYDDPDQFAINDYVPNTAHGSIIMTTRLPDLVSGQQVRVQPMRSLDESLEILQTRARRDHVKNGK